MSNENDRENAFLFYAKTAINVLTALTLFIMAVMLYLFEPITVNIEGIVITLPIIAISSLLLHFIDVKYKKVKATYFHYFLNSLTLLFLVVPLWVMLAVIIVSGGNSLFTLISLDIILVATMVLSVFNPRIKVLRRRSLELNNLEVKEGAQDITLRMGVKIKEIRVIDTNKTKIANAFQIGLVHQYVFITSFLAENLTANENIAIIAHELAHAQKKHIQKTLLFLGVEIGVLGNIFFLIAAFLFRYSARIGLFVGLVVSAFISVYLLLPFLRRKFEKEADITAANYIQPMYLADSLRKISELNHVPLNIPRYWNMSHPSTSERIEYLSRLKVRKGEETENNV